MRKLSLFLMMLVCCLIPFFSFAKESNSKDAKQIEKEQETEKKIKEAAEEKLQQMTLREKIYQMFIITPESLTGEYDVTAVTTDMEDTLSNNPVGGVIYFAKNIATPEQTKLMVNMISNYGLKIEGIPLFQCIDEEGGRVARIGKQKNFPVERVPAMGTIQSKEEAYQAGETIGKYLSNYGFNFDFAPDADVITNSKNKVIGDRSFGSDAAVVTEYAIAVSEGLQSQNILSTMKHFPGHGATEADTHEGFAYTNKTYEELLQEELVPFANAKAAGVDAIMVSHIAVPGVTGDDLPCTLSKYMITKVLRNDLGYDGLIVTDAMNMGAITQKYSADEAAVMTIQAGTDLVLMPDQFILAVQGVQEAVADGTITEERIDESVRRILEAKYCLLFQ